MNPVVILVEACAWCFELAMKTPKWAVKWVILPICCLLALGGLFAGLL